MKIKFIEVTQDDDSESAKVNWGKFAVGRWTTEEWSQNSALPEAAHQRLITGRGWTFRHVWVLDLQTGEGAYFMPGGMASYDLNKHRIWVCPMFEPFLEWLYKQDLTPLPRGQELDALPSYVELSTEVSGMAGYRREGPK